MRRRRRVSSLSQPRLVAATQSCRVLWRAKKSIKHFSAVPLPRGNHGQPGGNNGQVARCVYQMLISFSVFFLFFFLCFFLFTPRKVKVLPAHCPFQCPLILAYYMIMLYRRVQRGLPLYALPPLRPSSFTNRERGRKGEGETIALSCQVSALTLKE